MGFSRRNVLALGAAGGALLATTPFGAFADPPGSGKLVVWMFNQAVLDKLRETFAVEYPGYEIEWVQLPAPDLVQRLVIALQSGEGLPDVVQLLSRETGELFATGQFLDIAADLEPYMEYFPEGILQGSGEEIYAFQQSPGNMALWVHKTALAEHGLEIPADPTWAQVLEVAEALKQASGGTQYMLIQPPAANGFTYFNSLFNSRGGNWWDAEGNLMPDRELAIETLQFLADIHANGYALDTVWSAPDFWDLIKAKTVVGFAMNYPVGSTNLKRNVPEQAGEWQMVTWPRWEEGADKRTGNFGGAVFAGLKGGANNEGARDLILWWLTDAGLRAQFETAGLVAYSRAGDVVDLTVPDEYFGGQPVIAEMSSVPFPQFNFRHWAETVSAGTVAVDTVLSGDKTAEQAIDDFLAELGSI